MGEGYLETRFGFNDFLVAYQGNDPFQDTSKIFIAQVNRMEPIGEAEVGIKIGGKGYSVKKFKELDRKFQRFIYQIQRKKGWVTLSRKPRESIISFLNNKEKNIAERILTLQISPQDPIDHVALDVFTKTDLTILRDELIFGDYISAKRDYGSDNTDIDAKRDIEFYGRIISSLEELNLPNLRRSA